MSSYRRRDNPPAGYSSADAYRSVPSTSPSFQHARAVNTNGAASSSEEDHLTSPVAYPEPTPAPVANAFVRTRTSSRSRPRRESQDRGEVPLSPPRPGFLAGDRRSWSSGEAELNSDSDVSAAAGLAGVGAGATTSQPVRPPPTASRAPVRGHDRVRSNTSQAGGRTAAVPQPRTRNHRRRSSMANEYAYAGSAGEEEPQSPSSQGHSSYSQANPFGSPNDTPRNSFYGAQGPPPLPEKGRTPPSAFPTFPFQSHTGNPDPGTTMPGIGRRESIDSLAARAQNGQVLHTPGNTNQHPLSPSATGTAYPAGVAPGGYGLVEESDDLGRPYAPFMGDGPERSQTPPSPMAGQGIYRNSAAAAAAGNGQYGSDNGHGLPRTGSAAQIGMRAPFLSPASRPTSSLWAPPSFPYAYPPANGSSTALNAYAGSGLFHGQYSSYADIQAQLRKNKPILPSSKISAKLTKEDKPWVQQKDRRERASYWLTLAGVLAGFAGAAVLCYITWTETYFIADSQLCSCFYDDFSEGLDTTNTWVPDVELGGFGNGEFQATTTNSDNLHVTNGELYITPTLVSDTISGGYSSILDGGTLDLGSSCTTTNTTACSVTSSNKTGAVLNPVYSARISTKGTHSLKYGKVEVVAKLPQGDWLWPAIWMLPVNSTYGDWPLSGEIDIMEARGNPVTYTAQGVNYVRSSLNYAPIAALYTMLFGWWSEKQTTFADTFHTYTLEWTSEFMRLYVDTRLDAMLTVKLTGKGGKSFFDRGKYPSTTQNGSSQAVVSNIWEEAGGGANAPFDQDFYLLLDLAVGGTSGWFPDSVGGKPWYDESDSALREFAEAQSTWSATWPSSTDDVSFRIQSVRMCSLCS